MSILLIRHTRVVGTAGICYGRHEVQLADTFESELTELLAKLPGHIAAVWSSPARRCRALAERVARHTPVTIDTRLAELHFGQWEGRPWEELKGAAVEAWMNDPWRVRPPEGETVPEMVARVRACRDEIQKIPTRPVVVITHAGVIRAWRSLVEKRAVADLFSETIPYAGIWTEGFVTEPS